MGGGGSSGLNEENRRKRVVYIAILDLTGKQLNHDYWGGIKLKLLAERKLKIKA